MVPEGWTEGHVCDLLRSLEAGVSVNGEDRPLAADEKGVLKVSAVTYGKFNPLSVKAITAESELLRAKIQPRKGQIIISRSNTEELVGASAYVDDDYPNLFLPDKLWQTVPVQNVNMKWLSYVLASEHTRYTLSNLATGTSGSMKNITKNELLSIKVAIPTHPEQCKIAKILSTWDKAIATTEKLIETNKQQKKALMQQLLTGKKRSSGFDEKWEDRYLSDIAKIIVSPVDKKTIEGETPVRLCNYTDVYYNTRITSTLDFMKATAKQSEIDKYTLKVGDVIITKDSETPGDIAVPALVSENLNGVVCGYHLAIVRPNKAKVDGAFLNYLFSMPKTRYYFFTLATGATRFGLSVGGIHKAHFHLPPLEEQKKIASVLTAADKEIESLTSKLAHFKHEKKALMQQLLTGKRRVSTN